MKVLILSFLMMVMGNLTKAQSKVLMMVPDGFYGPEFKIPFTKFKSEGMDVIVATKYKSGARPDQRQQNEYPHVKSDLTFSEVDIDDFDAVVFVGGNGAWEDFFPNETAHKILFEAMIQNKVVALLCSSTGLLAVANNLGGNGLPIAKNRKVTGYKRVKGILIKIGQVLYSEGDPTRPYVVVDGRLITGRDPKSSKLFAKMVIQALK